MEVDEQQPQQPHDLVGGTFAVIESDPAVFTTLTRRLDIHGLELVELYDIEPWAVDHLRPHGLIFCFMWRRDTHRPTDFDDPAADRVWFANQLSDDACATHAILNVLLNCPDIDVGNELTQFRKDTEDMSPVMRGLAITNSPLIRPAHNYLARPSDLRASLNNITITTSDAQKRKEKEKENSLKQAKKSAANAGVKPPPAKRAKTTATKAALKGKAKDKQAASREDEEETYHFIGYVPAHGKVWELDGLKSGPLEVGELPLPAQGSSSSSAPGIQLSEEAQNSDWMSVVRPALRMKMEKYGGSATSGTNIRFSLLAIVDDLYQKASDELEFLKREKEVLERKLMQQTEQWKGDEWLSKVSQPLLQASQFAFSLPNQPPGRGRIYSKTFAFRRMMRDREIDGMSPPELLKAWETCVEDAMRAKISVEDELTKGVRANTDHTKRTFDYEPFLKAYIRQLHEEGLLNPLLDRDDDGKKRKGRSKG